MSVLRNNCSGRADQSCSWLVDVPAPTSSDRFTVVDIPAWGRFDAPDSPESSPPGMSVSAFSGIISAPPESSPPTLAQSIPGSVNASGCTLSSGVPSMNALSLAFSNMNDLCLEALSDEDFAISDDNSSDTEEVQLIRELSQCLARVLFTTQGHLTIYDSANQPMDKGAVWVSVMATAHNHHVFLVCGQDKRSIAEAVIGSHMQVRIDNQSFVVYYDNHKRFCALRLANPAAALDCVNQINNSIQTTTLVQSIDLEPGRGSTLAQDGFDVKLHYSGWLRNPDGSTGSLVSSSESGGGKPIAFKIGSNQAIVGFSKAVVGMRKAGKRRVLMPMALAVGANGVQSAPDSTSMMTFELTLTALRKNETHKFENEPDQPPAVAAAPPRVADDDTEVAKSPRRQRDALDSSVEMQPSTAFGVRQQRIVELQNRELKAQLASAAKGKRKLQKELTRQARQAAETCERWAREEVTAVNYMLSVVPHGMAADEQYCTKHGYYTAALAECVLCISLLYYRAAA